MTNHKMSDFLPLKLSKFHVILRAIKNALLCNGSTADSGSVCLGSTPSGATKKINESLNNEFVTHGGKVLPLIS